MTKSTRRYLTFSLRTLFILLAAFAVWLGVAVNRAREQREAVKAIEALGGSVFYDWELNWGGARGPGGNVYAQPPGPAWFRRFVGDDFFQEAREVAFSHFVPQPSDPTTSDVRKAIPLLQRLGGLRLIIISSRDKNIEGDLAAALPSCDVEYLN